MVLTPAELEHLADEVGDRYRALVLLAGWGGLRWGEAAGLRVANLNLLRRTVSVVESLTEVEGRLELEIPKTRAGRGL